MARKQLDKQKQVLCVCVIAVDSKIQTLTFIIHHEIRTNNCVEIASVVAN
jgi:hypothetical protein